MHQDVDAVPEVQEANPPEQAVHAGLTVASAEGLESELERKRCRELPAAPLLDEAKFAAKGDVSEEEPMSPARSITSEEESEESTAGRWHGPSRRRLPSEQPRTPSLCSSTPRARTPCRLVERPRKGKGRHKGKGKG